MYHESGIISFYSSEISIHFKVLINLYGYQDSLGVLVTVHIIPSNIALLLIVIVYLVYL